MNLAHIDNQNNSKLVLSYEGSAYRNPTLIGQCGVEIKRDENPVTVTVTITEPEIFDGASVTNRFEAIATKVYNLCLRDLNPKKIRWKHHEIRSLGHLEIIRDVSMGWFKDVKCYASPDWDNCKVLGDYRASNVSFSETHMTIHYGEGERAQMVGIPLERYPLLKIQKNQAWHGEQSGCELVFYEIGLRINVREEVLLSRAIEEDSKRVIPFSICRLIERLYK